MVQILRVMAAELNISKQQGLFLKNCLLQGDKKRLIDDEPVIFLAWLKAHLFTLSDHHCSFIPSLTSHPFVLQARAGEQRLEVKGNLAAFRI